MKTHIHHLTAALAAMFAASAVAQTIEIATIPAPGRGWGDHAKGRVVWPELTSANASRYAVIAMLDADWGDQYVKPYNNDYLNAVNAKGEFTININTGENDGSIENVLFYLVERATFAGVAGSVVKKGYMEGRYLAMLEVNRRAFWAALVPAPVPSVAPGFVPAGTPVALSCAPGDTVYYSVSGYYPSFVAANVYKSPFTVPAAGALIIHAYAVRSGGYNGPVSFTYLPRKPLDKPFFGLNASLILGSENPGDTLTEAEVRARLQPVAPLTQWVRTFGTVNNGLEHVNRIAKAELGLKTCVGLWISSDPASNAAQVEGLRAILQKGPAPDLVAVGNECSLSGVPADVLQENITAVRVALYERGLGSAVPIGSADTGGADWPASVLDSVDFVGVNLYCGTWDATPPSAMAEATAQFYTNEVRRLGQRMVLLTETGTPHGGGAYSVDGGSQTPSASKAAAYLDAMLDWTHNARIPLFYFSAYDEAWKSRNGGHAIEQYFGLLGADGVLHAFYGSAVTAHQPPSRDDAAYLSDPESAGGYPAAGTTAYDGFVYGGANTVRGTMTLNAKAAVKKNKDGTATTTWTFSAKAVLQAATASFSGTAAGAAGRFTATAKTGETLDVRVEGSRFYGTLSGGRAGGTLNVDGARNAFADKKDAAAQARLDAVRGLYNLALVEPLRPSGVPQQEGALALRNPPPAEGRRYSAGVIPSGCLTLTVGNAGAVKLAGKLADGSAISGSAKLMEWLNEDGWMCVALHRPLYSKKGFIGGLLWLDPAGKVFRIDTRNGWFMSWVCEDPKKTPFARDDIDVVGGWFSDGKATPAVPAALVFGADVPATLPPLVPGLTGGRWLDEAFPTNLTVSVVGAKRSLPKGTPSGATLSYTVKTGVFKGAFKLYYDGTDAKGKLQHKSVSVPYTGLMIPTRDAAFAGSPIGLGAGTAAINKETVSINVFLSE